MVTPARDPLSHAVIYVRCDKGACFCPPLPHHHPQPGPAGTLEDK